MTPFWRDTLLTEDESKLLQLTLEAHAASAFRNNVSSAAVFAAAQASGDYTKALVGALSTLGGVHAPLVATWELLQAGDVAAEELLLKGKLVPGWGNSFHKGEPDPLWQPVAQQLEKCNPTLAERLNVITELLLSAGKSLFPNPSAYTAATAITLGIPAELSPWLFVQGRLASWSHLFLQSLKGVA